MKWKIVLALYLLFCTQPAMSRGWEAVRDTRDYPRGIGYLTPGHYEVTEGKAPDGSSVRGRRKAGRERICDETEKKRCRNGAEAVLKRPGRGRWEDCRPWIRWWWNGDMVDSNELKRELQVLHRAGIGGVEINPIEFPSKRCDALGQQPLEWLGEEWTACLAAALREARRLGMGCDLLVGSGWPFGMESLAMEERAQVMLTLAVPFAGDTVLTKEELFEAADPQVTVPNSDRRFELVGLTLTPDSISSISEAVPLPSGDTIAAGSPDGSKRMLYALIRCRSFASVINGAPGASGPIVDHFNRRAVRRFLDRMSQTLAGRLGPMKQWLRAYFMDSMELEGSNWTDDMAAEFERRRGYDLMPWLPFTMFKTGRLGEVASYTYGARQGEQFRQEVARVRHDFELTKAELLRERCTETFAAWCREQGVASRAQAYGRGFFPLQSSLCIDIPEGESWTTNYLRHRVGYEMGDEDYRRGRAYTMIDKYVSSAAHQSGRRLVSAEEMTNTYMLFNTPLELLKAGSDMSAFSGITHSVWHGFNYMPPSAPFPGWVQYGSYYNERNTWWPFFRRLNDYRARMSFALREAQPSSPIAILLPTDEMWGELGVQTEPFPNYPKGSKYNIPQLLWEAVHKNGGGCDFVSPLQLKEARCGDSLLRVGEAAYRLFILPDLSNLDSTALERLAQFAEGGGRVVCLGGIPNRRQPSAAAANPLAAAALSGRVVTEPLPADGAYLEYYALLQERLGLPHSVGVSRPDRFLLHNHLTTSGGHLFLFSNAHLDQCIETRLQFEPSVWQGRSAWVLDCADGLRQAAAIDSGSLTLRLGPAESLLLLFTLPGTDSSLLEAFPIDTAGRLYTATTRQPLLFPDSAATVPLPIGQWQVSLQHALLTETTDTLLTRLDDLAQVGFPHFAGTAVYTARFTLDTLAGAEWIDLGQVCDIGELRLNGRTLGIRWFGRHRWAIPPGLLHRGENTIEIAVTTRLNNYARSLTEDKVVQHFVLKRNIPPCPTGLIGPVALGRAVPALTH